MKDDWEYLVSGYYNEKGKRPNKLAIEVGVNGEALLSQEVTIFSQREDIGRIMIVRRRK